jgi:hypothetical protein
VPAHSCAGVPLQAAGPRRWLVEARKARRRSTDGKRHHLVLDDVDTARPDSDLVFPDGSPEPPDPLLPGKLARSGRLREGRGRSSMAELQPSKLVMRVRSPSPARLKEQLRGGELGIRKAPRRPVGIGMPRLAMRRSRCRQAPLTRPPARKRHPRQMSRNDQIDRCCRLWQGYRKEELRRLCVRWYIRNPVRLSC